MRCAICGIWKIDSKNIKDSELSLEEFESILSDRLFSQLEFININGGEPHLREDLPLLAELFIHKFKKLRTLTINSNGLPPHKVLSNTEKIALLCKKKKVRFSVSISLHELGTEFERIAGISGAFEKVNKTLQGLKELQKKYNFYLSTNCVITPLNLYGLKRMMSWAERKLIPVNFTLGEVRERFNNLEQEENVRIEGKAKAYLIKFLKDLAQNKSLLNHHVFRYWELARMVEKNSERNLACHYAIGGVILGSKGELYYCKDSRSLGNCLLKPAHSIYLDQENLRYRRENLIREKCKKCPPNTFNRFEFEKDLLKFLKFLVLRH